MIFLLYAIAMDGAAVHFRNYSLLSDLKKVHHSDEIGQPFDVLYSLPVVALVFDIVALFMYIAALACTMCYYKLNSDHQKYSVPSVTPSFLGPLLCLISHLPYIAIAYINDAYYAGSIFVYHMVVFFVSFAAIHITSKSCFEFWVLKESNICSRKCLSFECIEQGRCDFKRLMCPLITIVIFLVLCTVAMVICYFVIITLNASVSSAPHQLIGFYQTIIIFLGIFLAYITVLHKKNGLKSAVVNRNGSLSKEEWKKLPDEEKKRKFYDMVIDVVEHKCKKYEQTKQSSQTESAEIDSRSLKEGSEQGCTQHSPPNGTTGEGSGRGDTKHLLPTGSTGTASRLLEEGSEEEGDNIIIEMKDTTPIIPPSNGVTEGSTL